jgi:hypothetical protein
MTAEAPSAAGPLILRPIALRHARAFVAEHHRHNLAPRGWLFGVALELDGAVVAVAIAGRPVARALDDGRTLEITRCCTLGHRNAASRLYGALCRAGAALGYARAITYTLASEPGTSLRASGFTMAEELAPRESWASANRGRQAATLWGQPVVPEGRKVRWERQLT